MIDWFYTMWRIDFLGVQILFVLKCLWSDSIDMIIDYFLFDFRKALLSSDFTIICLVV